METKWIAIILAILLSGCSTPPVKLRTETVEVVKPILYCPAPDVEVLGRPSTLAIDQITASTSQGEIAVLYKASMKQLIDYIDRMEQTIAQYAEFNKSYEELIKELELQNID